MVSPLTLPLTQSLGNDVYVWSYAEDFDRLWALLKSGNPEIRAKRQVILWSNTPHGNCFPVDTGPFVSPLIWALCAANRFGTTQVRVTVVDLAPERNQSVELRHHLEILKENATPWLRMVAWRDLLVDSNASLSSIVLGNAPLQAGRGDESDARPLLLDSLRLRLTDPLHPDKRHAVANVLGPLLLLERRPQSLGQRSNGSGEADHLAALEQIVSDCGLVTAREASNRGSGGPRPRPRLPRKTCVVLVDDQWHHGWAEWVCDQLELPYMSPPSRTTPIQQVGVSDRTEVRVAHDPSVVVEALTMAINRADHGSDRRLRLSLTGRQDANEVLLLDLRLFSGHKELELAFFRTVLPICRRFVGPNHAWPGFTSDELADVERLCATGAGLGPSDSALTIGRGLLARLVALVDCSFPIVLFSSTGERKLIERMAPYRNVVTSFSKPRLHGVAVRHTGAHWSEEVGQAFQAALEKAASLLRLRNLLAPSGGRPFVALAEPQLSPDVPHVSMYIDESGSVEQGELSLTGIVAVYPDHACESYFQDTLERHGVRWGPGNLPKRRLPGVAIGEFEATQAEVAQTVLDEATSQNIVLSVVNLKADPKDWIMSQGDASDPYLADNLHRWMTKALVEVALFRLLPWKLSATELTRFSLSVFTDLRSAAWPSSMEAQAREACFGYKADHSTTPEGRTILAANALADAMATGNFVAKWPELSNQVSLLREAIRVTQDDLRLTRVPPYGVVPVLQDLLEAYRDHPICRAIASIKEARAVALTRATGVASKAHPLHSWVDWLSNAMAPPILARPAWFEAFRDRSATVVDLRFRPTMRAVLAIERRLDVAVDRAAGLRRLIDERRSVMEEETPGGLLRHDVVDNAIARAAASMTGSEFVEAAFSAVSEPSTGIRWRVSNFDAGVSESEAVDVVREALECCSSVEIDALASRLSKKSKPVVEASFTASEADLLALEATMKKRWTIQTAV